MTADESSKNDDCSLAYIDALVSLGQRVGKTLFSDLGDAGLFTLHHRLYSEMDLELGYQRKSFIDLFLKCGGQFLKEAQRFRLVTEAHSIYATPEAPGSLMNNLAGNWLALYFMGIPFVHLWEPVMFFSEGSGFPRGASLCKVVGDIYRDSRIAYVRDPSKGSRVLVLDHNPLAFPSLERSLQTLLKNGQHTSETLLETANAYLGALYELLQLRLYLHAGAPIKFMVPQASLLQAFKSGVEKLPEKEQLEKHEEDIAYLWRSLEQGFPSKYAEQQAVDIVILDDDMRGMPGCVLSRELGAIRPRGDKESIFYGPDAAKGAAGEPSGTSTTLNFGPAGNYLPSRLLSIYLERLDEVTVEAKGLRAKGQPDFDRLCRGLLGIAVPPAT